jgi:hypothetical protein
MKQVIKKIINKMPHVQGLYRELNDLKNKTNEYEKNSCFPPGHFYSPIVSVDSIRENENEIWKGVKNDEISGINLNAREQVLLLQEFSKYYHELPFKLHKVDGQRYFFDNEYYSYTDAIVLYSMMRHFKPKRIIEVGSGFFLSSYFGY